MSTEIMQFSIGAKGNLTQEAALVNRKPFFGLTHGTTNDILTADDEPSIYRGDP